MKPDSFFVSLPGPYTIYVEYFPCESGETDQTIILVNGAYATTDSFTRHVRYLRKVMNVVGYDAPFAGQSQARNPAGRIVPAQDEAEILLGLIERVKATAVLSMSWGGVTTLLALAQRPAGVERAVVASFSPVINEPMRAYMSGVLELLARGDCRGAAELVNNTIGSRLPARIRAINERYLAAKMEGREEQLAFHVRQAFEMDAAEYAGRFSAIDIPVLFLNGSLDEYTTSADVRGLSTVISRAEFLQIEGVAHFMDLESTPISREIGVLTTAWLAGPQRMAA